METPSFPHESAAAGDIKFESVPRRGQGKWWVADSLPPLSEVGCMVGILLSCSKLSQPLPPLPFIIHSSLLRPRRDPGGGL